MHYQLVKIETFISVVIFMDRHIENLMDRFLKVWREYQQTDMTLDEVKDWCDNQTEYWAYAIYMIRLERE